MGRQPLDVLMDRLYDDAGMFGDMMNIVDPAGRAEHVSPKFARRCSPSASGPPFGHQGIRGRGRRWWSIPFDQIATIPALTLLSSHIARIMGKAENAGR